MMANKLTANRLLDPEDERLTAGERQQLRQIALRLRDGAPVVTRNEVVTGVVTPRQTDLEEEIAKLFAVPKSRDI